MSKVTFITPDSVNSESLHTLVEPFINEIEKQSENDARLEDNIAKEFGFQDFYPSNKEGQIITKLGIYGAPIVGERDEYTMSEKLYGPKIGYGVKRVFPASEITSEAEKWMTAGWKESDLNDVIKQEIQSSFGSLTDEINSIKMTENEYLLKIIALGFNSVKAEFGPESKVYDSKGLFAVDHEVIKTGEFYSNIVTEGAVGTIGTTHVALTFDSLKKAVEMSRTMKDGLGKRVKRPMDSIYDLYVAPEGESNALDVLSDTHGFMPYTYTGADAGNGNYANIFVRKGFKVRLNVVDGLNQPDSTDPENLTIGSATMWFVINKSEAIRRSAFRKIILGDITIEISRDPKTKLLVASAEKHFGGEILYPEVIVGSKGDGSTI